MTEQAPITFSSILVLVVLSLISIQFGRKRNFFSLPKENEGWKFDLKLRHVVSVFVIYLCTLVFLTPQIATIVQKIVFQNPNSNSILAYITWVQFIHSIITFFLLFGFFFLLPKSIWQNIWIDQNSHACFFEDMKKAVMIGVLSFPIIGLANQSIDFFLTNIMHITEMPDQLAIHFLKMTFGHRLYFILSISTIVFFAPLIEELLFRGFLQSYIRQHLGSFKAIFISSLVFAFYHYAPEQGVTNITIIGSIFVCSCFFGFIYEKRRSLKASILMHGFFNGLNVCNLYFLGGIPGGYL